MSPGCAGETTSGLDWWNCPASGVGRLQQSITVPKMPSLSLGEEVDEGEDDTMKRTTHLSEKNAEKADEKELNKKNSRISGFYTRKIGNRYVNYYYSK